jgi:hypothetical protein
MSKSQYKMRINEYKQKNSDLMFREEYTDKSDMGLGPFRCSLKGKFKDQTLDIISDYKQNKNLAMHDAYYILSERIFGKEKNNNKTNKIDKIDKIDNKDEKDEKSETPQSKKRCFIFIDMDNVDDSIEKLLKFKGYYLCLVGNAKTFHNRKKLIDKFRQSANKDNIQLVKASPNPDSADKVILLKIGELLKEHAKVFTDSEISAYSNDYSDDLDDEKIIYNNILEQNKIEAFEKRYNKNNPLGIDIVESNEKIDNMNPNKIYVLICSKDKIFDIYNHIGSLYNNVEFEMVNPYYLIKYIEKLISI